MITKSLPKFDKKTTARFMQYVTKTKGCWNWNGSITSKGYGQFRLQNGENSQVHRVSWHIHNGPIPQGMCVLHKCDNPRCMNPDHLWLGTQLQNIRDMHAKGRVKCGEEHRRKMSGDGGGNSKLTWDDVDEIRRTFKTGNLSGAQVGKKYGVGQSQIYRIVQGKTWLEKYRPIPSGVPV